MAQIPGSIPVTGKIAPTDTLDTFATHESQYGIGDKHVLDTVARDAITEQRRVWGMLCHTEDGSSFQLVKGSVDNDITNNANWQPFTLGSSLTIAAGSANYLDITNDELSVKSLLVTSVTTDAAADLATFVAASYTVGNEFQEGDVIILTTPSEVYIHNGGTLPTPLVDHFTVIDVPNLSDTYIRNLLSATGPLSYNPTTGDFTISQATTSTDGYLSSTDWNTFNNKLSSFTETDPVFSASPAASVINSGGGAEFLADDGTYKPVSIPVDVVGIADASGVYTYYSTLQAAITAASAGQTVELFSDITEIGAVEITCFDGLKINFNGHTYTLNNATAIPAFNTGANNTVNFFNGKVVRSGLISSNTTDGCVYGLGVLISQAMVYENNDGVTANVAGLQGGTFYNGATYGGSGVTGVTVKDVNYRASGNCYLQTTNTIQNCSAYSSGGAALRVLGIANDCSAYSIGGSAILGGSNNCLLYNCTAWSSAGFGIDGAGNSFYGCTAYSGANIAIDCGIGFAYHCFAESTANYGISVLGAGAIIGCTSFSSNQAAVRVQTGSVINCYLKSTLNTSTGYGIKSSSGTVSQVHNCTIEVVNASAFCIDGAGTVNYSNNTFRGATTPVEGTQGITNTSDSQGNILI